MDYGASPEQVKVYETIFDPLAHLGKTPDEVAMSLAAEGIKGIRGKSQDCPIARYVATIYPEWFTVGLNTIITHGQSVYLPESIVAFIRRFDKGFYPELDEEYVLPGWIRWPSTLWRKTKSVVTGWFSKS